MPERHGVGPDLQNPGPFGVGDRGDIPDQVPEQSPLGPTGHDGELVEGRPDARAEPAHPGEHRVDHRVRDRRGGAGEHLGDEERVAARHLVQVHRVDGGVRGELRDRLAGQPPQGQAVHRRPAEHAEDALQRVVAAHLVVAVAQHEHRGQVVDAAADVTAVRPTWRRRTSARPRSRAPSGGADRPTPRAARRTRLPDRPRGPTPRRAAARRRVGGIPQRSDARGVEQVLARPCEDPRPPVERGQERPDQAGLADARLTRDQHRRTRARSPPRRRPTGAHGAPSAVRAAASPGHRGTRARKPVEPAGSAGRRDHLGRRCPPLEPRPRARQASATGTAAAASAAATQTAGPMPASEPGGGRQVAVAGEDRGSTAIPTTDRQLAHRGRDAGGLALLVRRHRAQHGGGHAVRRRAPSPRPSPPSPGPART